MTWLMMWLNRNVATIIATLQLLDIYRLVANLRNARKMFLFTIVKNTISILRTQMVKLKAVHS